MGDNSPLISPSVRLVDPLASWLDRNNAKLRTRRWKVIVSASYCLAMAALGCVYAAQGPATIALAEQCGIVQATPRNGTSTSTSSGSGSGGGDGGKIDARHLPEIGIANALDAGAGVIGGFVGGWLCDRSRRWHRILSLYLITQGVAFICFTLVRSFSGLLAVSLAWGYGSTLTSVSTQAAMTWLWDRPTFWLQLNNCAFGVGALAAPALVSLDVRSGGTYHRAYYAIGAVNMAAAVAPLLLPTPQRRDHAGSDANANVITRVDASSHLAAVPPRAVGSADVGRGDGGGDDSKGDGDDSKGEGNDARTGIATAADIDDGSRRALIVAHNVTVVRQRSAWPVWVVFMPFFGFYVAAELGLANWLSPFATLLGLASDGNAALLTTVFYSSFALTRLLAAPLSRRVAPGTVLCGALLGALASSGVLIYAAAAAGGSGGSEDERGAGTGAAGLWTSVCLLGFFMGPIWPAWQGLLAETYGVPLRASDMAIALAFSKVGMAGEQVLFSWLLAVTSRGKLFGVGVAVFLGICALMLVVQLCVVLPRSGLVPLTCHTQRGTGNSNK